ncbi:MAG: biopolymer transporter ExbD [Campylobacterales bacterium]|nr:biopolymer transporter ExbD [Campylobacterales bacterium]
MKRKKFTTMNVVPFIDIVLVLLVIVLATASFATKNQLSINLPTSSSETKEEPKKMVIAIDKQGNYTYDGQKISLTDMAQKLSLLDPDSDAISLYTDETADFKYFVAVIDILKKRNFEKISIVTKSE